MKIEKNAYRKSIHNTFYIDQMNVLSVAKKMHLFYNICVTYNPSMCKNMH